MSIPCNVPGLFASIVGRGAAYMLDLAMCQLHAAEMPAAEFAVLRLAGDAA